MSKTSVIVEFLNEVTADEIFMSYVKSLVLLSLFTQWVLLLASFRKRTGNSVLKGMIFVFHWLSPMVAMKAFFFIVTASYFSESKLPYSLWAAVTMLHLSGQERLTAYSIEDNNLWRKSTLLISWQILVHIRVFPHWDQPVATWIMFYLAWWRIFCRALRLIMGTKEMMGFSCMIRADNLGDLLLHSPNPVDGNSDDSNWKAVRNAHILLQSSSRGLLAGVKCSYTYQVSQFFSDTSLPASYAIRIAEIELNFIYESFHTDGTIRKLLNHNWSLVYVLIRSIEFIFFVAALTFYAISSSSHLHSAHISRVNYDVTNVLLWGTVALESFSLIRTVVSDWTIAASKGSHYFLRLGRKLFQFVPQKRRWWSAAEYKPYDKSAPVWAGFARILFRRWSERISKFNILRYSIKVSNQRWIYEFCVWLIEDWITFTQNLIKSFLFVTEQWYTDHLGEYVFRQLQNTEPDIIKNLKIDRSWLDDYDSYITHVQKWHIVTELMFVLHSDNHRLEHCENSKLLSDYMAYLLCMKPRFLANSWRNPLEQFEVGREYIKKKATRYQDRTLEDRLILCCQQIIDKEVQLDPISKNPLKDDHDCVKNLLPAIELANDLHIEHSEDIGKLWLKLSEEWVKILLFAASSHNEWQHVDGLCRGGELVTIVWLLAFHLKIIK